MKRAIRHKESWVSILPNVKYNGTEIQVTNICAAAALQNYVQLARDLKLQSSSGDSDGNPRHWIWMDKNILIIYHHAFAEGA